MAALALIVFTIALVIGLIIAVKTMLKGIAAEGSAEAFAAKRYAENEVIMSSNRGLLFASFIALSISFIALQVNPYFGWPFFLASVWAFTGAFADVVLDTWADKELHGGFEAPAQVI